MKKIFFAALALLVAGTAMAGENKHSIGLTVGSLNGITYKYFFTEKFALQNDLVVGFQATAGGEQGDSDLDHKTISTVEFVYNPNALYHLSLGSTGLNMAFGGGLSIGIGRPYYYRYWDGDYRESSYDSWFGYTKRETPKMGGKFGINAFAGIEYPMPSAPVVFAFDFRPGYGVMFASARYEKGSEWYKTNVTFHTFDWRLSLSMRYCF